MPKIKNSTELKSKLQKAQEAEKHQQFFLAAHLFKEALILALKVEQSETIKLCKNKIVEMNKKSITSGNDFRELNFTQKIPEDRQKEHEEFINKFLNQGDLKKILLAIGKHPYFFPSVDMVQKTANKSLPISYQIASMSTISNEGHFLRGGSEGGYSWFTKMYDIHQKLVMNLYLGRIIYELMENKPNGINLNLKELSDYFSKSGIFEQQNLEIILAGLRNYFEKDYISSMHILIPQFEAVFLKFSEKLDIDIVALDQKQGIATRTKVLSEKYLDSEEFIKVWGIDLCRQIRFILFEPMGYRLRHKIAHGEIDPKECNFDNTTLILYLYLVLISRIEIKSI